MIRLLCYFILACCISCGQQDSSRNEQSISLNINMDPPTLDPRRALDTTSATVLRMLREGLMRPTEHERAEPAIAESVTVSPDKKTYTFKLRDTVWSNGDPLTAYDFERTWKSILDPKNPAEYAYKLYVIKNAKKAKLGQLPLDQIGIHALDDKTLVVELEHPTPYFLQLLTLMTFYPVKDNLTNGPFLLDLWKHNNKMIFKKNPTYWNADKVKLQEIRLYMVPDANTELSMFENGELDFAGTPLSIGLPTDAIPILKKSGKLHTNPEAATYFFQMNVSHPLLNNTKFRKALAYSINRKDIVENIMQGNQIPALSFLPPAVALDHKAYYKDHDIEQARILFREALQEMHLKAHELPPLILSYNTGEGHHKIAQAIQQQIKEALGITLTLENREWKVYLDKLQNRDFDIARMSWVADFSDPVSFLEVFQYKDSASNSTGWHDPRYSALLEEAANETDEIKRRKLLSEAEDILMDAMPIIPVYFLTTNYLINPRLKGVLITSFGDLDFKDAYVEND